MDDSVRKIVEERAELEFFKQVTAALATLEQKGLIEIDSGGNVRATPKGLALTDEELTALDMEERDQIKPIVDD